MPEGAGPAHAVTRALSRNESPHDPSPGILATVAASGRDVNRYPDPACTDLILALAHRHGVEPDRVAGDGVRVSIGSPSDNDAFLAAARRWRVHGAPQLLTTGAVG